MPPSLPYDPKKVYRTMAKARALEERLIKMAMGQDGHFWIGGPGEEAFNVPLGLLIHKGFGPAFDYVHAHYRSSGVMVAMGVQMIDPIRQMASLATDPFSGGRVFCSHYAIKEWNVIPVTSAIEVQYAMAPGTAIANKRNGGDGITIVIGGDAGTAEGDFATCLNWATRPGEELPILMIITNNRFGISTPYHEVQGAKVLARRAEPFGIRWDTVDGNDPEASWKKLSEAMAYVRSERKPFCLEAYVSRLHGHSSSSGARRVEGQLDCLLEFEKKLVTQGIFKKEECEAIRRQYADEGLEALKRIRNEPKPASESVFEHIYR